MVGGGGGCSCMLLLHPVPTSADAGPDLCTLCPDLCTLHPDLWTLCLWCFPSFNWCKHSTCTGGGCHQLQLALVVLFHSATSADSPLAHVVVSPSATCAIYIYILLCPMHVSVYAFARTYVSVHVCMCIHHVYNKVVSTFTITIIAKSVLSLRTMYNRQC